MILNSIIDKDEAEKTAVTFFPKKFPMRITEHAVSFHKMQSGEKRTDFRIDHSVSEQTGIGELERLSIEERVEQQALIKVKEMQEEAYKAGHLLGRDEGNKAGFEECKLELAKRLESFDDFLFKIENLKAQLISHNEVFLLKLLYQMASKIAMVEIAEKPEIILEVLKQVAEAAQVDQKMTVKLAPSDLKFIVETQEKLSKNFDFIKNLKLEEAPEMSPGGCRVETNYGAINATVEQRVEKLWHSLIQKTPRTKDELGDGI